jgi:hypothetical protein
MVLVFDGHDFFFYTNQRLSVVRALACRAIVRARVQR